MKADKRMEAGRFITAVVLAACVLPSARAEQATQPAAAESALPAATDAKAEPGISNVGIIKGNDVYVRSGFHQNYYPVTKLNKGDKITVLGEEYGWLKIEPPAGAYSLVEKVLIDKIDEQTGEANGEVTVYAGSNLNDRRYAKQVKLDKGARVQLI
ncbi:MAG TPA: SH3 domain-containing protein, partial [Phycisphaerae bacterium]|nr:SH3 domain-containing protein [Phycisphaerae bacterium]